MSTTLIIGIIAAIACGALNSIAILWKKKGAMEAPEMDIKSPIKSMINLFQSKFWVIGVTVSIVAWLMHLLSLGTAPMSIAQTLPAVGLLLIPLFGLKWFNMHPSKQDWWGVGMCAIGLALMALTISFDSASATDHSSYSSGAMAIFSITMLVVGFITLTHHNAGKSSKGISLAAMAGAMYALLAFSIKGALMAASIFSAVGWIVAILIFAVIAFYASARALQIGEVLPVSITTVIVTNISTVMGGLIIFGDSLGTSDLMIAARILSFIAFLVAAILLTGAAHKIPDANAQLESS